MSEGPPARPFPLLVKPASADCNLRCAYCFYLPKAALYPGRREHRMSPRVLERLGAGPGGSGSQPRPPRGFVEPGVGVRPAAG